MFCKLYSILFISTLLFGLNISANAQSSQSSSISTSSKTMICGEKCPLFDESMGVSSSLPKKTNLPMVCNGNCPLVGNPQTAIKPMNRDNFFLNLGLFGTYILASISTFSIIIALTFSIVFFFANKKFLKPSLITLAVFVGIFIFCIVISILLTLYLNF
jgi:hypothetical protein